NQPDISRGTRSRREVDAIDGAVQSRLAIDDVRVCPHDDKDHCACRKPAPGLLLEAARDWNISLEESVMVGDRWRDIEAGKRAGVRDYESFAKEILRDVKDRPISFEVFSDEFGEMESQAMKIASWGQNVYVKIPVTNTRGESAAPLIARLAKRGVKVNATAILTVEQVQTIARSQAGGPPAVISVVAGRIADTGVDPLPIVKA